ncbi:glycosyltransferase family 2 protein [Rubrobacter aplysinae]|uniref:glycosyltransferase family 2 protein n=1 Tax=Rubrobacter aplysinae TaxID=909625 RepID=UPI001F3970B7|nr:glycosyltransferase family 2 protein [Rubrobacter aplysinae]
MTVVVPNWNGAGLLRSCLESLFDQVFEDFETLVVDNGSTDGSVEMLGSEFPEVRVVALKDNRGFSAAANLGVSESDSELVALLNNDTRQDPDWLAALVRAADAYPEAGSFATKMLDLEKHGVMDGAGDALRRSGLPYRLGHGETDRGHYEKPRPVFGACAAAALYRRDMLESVGPFDEDFFAYCEDTDLSFRAQLAGYTCRYIPEAVVYHLGGASSGGKRSPTATRLGTQNGINLLVKNLPAPLFPRLAPFMVAGQFSRLAMTARNFTGLRANLAGYAGALRLLPVMLRKRRAIQAGRKAPDEYISGLLRNSFRAANASMARRLRDAVSRRLGWPG